tara:strand:+ start:56 stop:262 length:207 start_codon:yes stop_codon:yes gene_type:complete
MEKQVVETIIKETKDIRHIKCFDEIGNEWATHITTYKAECKHCDYVQIQNRSNIILHQQIMHNIEYED